MLLVSVSDATITSLCFSFGLAACGVDLISSSGGSHPRPDFTAITCGPGRKLWQVASRFIESSGCFGQVPLHQVAASVC